MKKNRMMRLSAILLVAVLLSLSVIGGTWAKYVSNKEQSETVTVAKWGVEIAATVDTNVYQSGDVVTDADDTIKLDVANRLIAPGFEAKFCDFNITGEPEVSAKVSYDAELTLTGWTLEDASDYCPLVFTVNGTEYKIVADDPETPETEISTVALLEEAVEGAIEAVAQEFAEGTNLSAATDLVVSCSWAFEGANANDTYLANQNPLPTIELSITCKVEQIAELTE